MSNTWGRNITVTIFGESHGPAIGAVIGGLPAGFGVDWDAVRAQMARRAPGGALASQRREADVFEILSGVCDGALTGTPLAMMIRNVDVRSHDYTPQLLRPGHADLSALYKYGGHADMRGGGHFSGRLTAPLVFAGAIARQLLEQRHGVELGAHIASIADVRDDELTPAQIIAASCKAFPAHSDERAQRMKEVIEHARDDGDSVGGIITAAAVGAPGGLGDPFFDSLESRLSALLFSIPAVKGVSFGGGFALTEMRGSEANDAMAYRDGDIALLSNHNGGVTGGITNGAPIVVTVAVKPTPTIAKEQTTVDIEKQETVVTRFSGRHDPCIVPRAVPVVEAALALCLFDLLV